MHYHETGVTERGSLKLCVNQISKKRCKLGMRGD
jgi:hypothetical protein